MDRRRLILSALVCAFAPALAHASSGGEKERKKTGGASYIPLTTLSGSSNRPIGRRGVMTVECGVDVPDEGLRARAEASLPRLRAAYVQAVQIYAAGLAPGAPPNADFLSLTLQRETDRILGKRGAKFLLGAVVVN